jgi:hypothetical protein
MDVDMSDFIDKILGEDQLPDWTRSFFLRDLMRLIFPAPLQIQHV